MQEDITVYEALRAHILQKEGQIANETIYMYVIYFALLTIGSIWNDWMSLLSFVSLIVFQSMINEEQWEIGKASIYIRVFFETQCSDIHWESLHVDPFYSSVFLSTIRKTVGWYISKCGATILSILSLVSIIIPILYTYNYQISNIPLIPSARIIFAVLLCIVTIFVNKQYFSVRESEKVKIGLTDAISTFYKNSRKDSDEVVQSGEKTYSNRETLPPN